MAIADRIVVMNEGRIEDLGTPEKIYLEPRSLFSAGFMGEVNRIPVTPSGQGAESALGPLALTTDKPGTLCLRPENVGLKGSLALGPARLTDAAFFGTYHRCHFTPAAAPDMQIVAHLPLGDLPETGAEVALWGTNPMILEAA